MASKVQKQVKELTESVLTRTDLFLVDVEIKGSREPVVWVYIDTEENGVSMDECAEVSQELGFLLDAHALFKGKYRLNVSSPGLSRPLTDRRQFPKNKGRKARVKYRGDGEYHKVEGVLREIGEDEIIVENEDGNTQAIRFEQLVETKIVPSL